MFPQAMVALLPRRIGPDHGDYGHHEEEDPAGGLIAQEIVEGPMQTIDQILTDGDTR